MTLCLAWKQDENIYFISDSRLTDNDKNIITDNATKIYNINLKLFSSTSSDTSEDNESPLYDSSFGMCFSGSYLNGSILADTIGEIFSTLQVAPDISDYSLEALSNIAFNIYKQVSTQLTMINREAGLCEVLFGGYCPIYKNFSLYKFHANFENETIEYKITKQNLTNEAILIGNFNAQEKAKELIKNINKDYNYFHLLQDIIIDHKIPEVGGEIQNGIFKNHEFKIYGIVESEKKQDEFGNETISNKFKFRGIEINYEDDDIIKYNMIFKKNYFDPFKILNDRK
jgi:hypothetical protein